MHLDSVSALPWSFPEWYWILKSYPINVKAHQVSLPDGSRRDISHFRAWWSTTTVKWLPRKYGLHFWVATITDNFSRSVTEYFFSVSKRFPSSTINNCTLSTTLYLSEAKANTISTSVSIQCKTKMNWAVLWVLICMVHLTVCPCHVTYAFQRESTIYSCLNVKKLLAQSRREIWSLGDCNWTRTHNHLVNKRKLNDLAKLASLP